MRVPVRIVDSQLSRREFGCVAGAACVSPLLNSKSTSRQEPFKLNYLLASCMYGYLYVGEILPEVKKTGAMAIDLWPKVHGNQREQLTDLGEERFAEMLKQQGTRIGCITQFQLGPFGLANEMKLANRFGCRTIVTGGDGPGGLRADGLKQAVKNFVEKMKPHLELAEKSDVKIAIENHANGLFETADSLKWLVEFRPSEHLGVALAPYHLPQQEEEIAELIVSLGEGIELFYAWQHGEGCHQRLPKERELLQLPGRGPLDFKPILAALKEINYSGWTEIFMHPVPRGIPILESASLVSKEINRSRTYLQQQLIEVESLSIDK